MMDYLLIILPMVIAGVIFRIVYRDAPSDSNKVLLVVIIALAIALFIVSIQGVIDGPPLGFGLTAAIVYNLFKIRWDPDIGKPKLYMQDGKVNLSIPEIKTSFIGHRIDNIYDQVYAFDEVSLTRN